MNKFETTGSEVEHPDARPLLRHLAFPLVVTYAFLPLAFLVPILDATREPSLDLSSWLVVWAYGITQTGGPAGASVVGLVVLVLMVTRARVTGRQRLLEAVVIFSTLACFAGGGAALNEYAVKPAFNQPRPNIVYLAGTGGSGPLRMPAREFHALGRDARRQHLRAVLAAEPPPVRLPRLLREHWIESTGYSLPSGHSFTAMFFATFCLAMGTTLLAIPRLLFSYLLLPWAVCVCYSRLILRVHTAMDISVGGLTGLLLGVLAFVVARAGITAAGRWIAPTLKS
jgi:phosphatidylglycerophosphatase B